MVWWFEYTNIIYILLTPSQPPPILQIRLYTTIATIAIIIIIIIMANCCVAVGALHTYTHNFWKCKQSNRKSNKHFNPSHFVCIFVLRFHFHFRKILPVSLILHGKTTVEPMAMLYFWPIVKNPGEWLSSSIKFSWYRGVAITPTHIHVWFGYCVWFWHGNRHADKYTSNNSRPHNERWFRLRCTAMQNNEKKEKQRENTMRILFD